MNIGLKTRFRPFEQFSSQTNQHVFKMDGSSRYHWCRFRNLKSISPAALSCPLDAFWKRSSETRIANKKTNDGKALTELDLQLRQFEPSDPVKYDFALFGLGVLKVFKTNLIQK
jgi:hypothetical protein